MTNVIPFKSKKTNGPSPLDRFCNEIDSYKGQYLPKPLMEVIRTFLTMTEDKLWREALIVLDGLISITSAPCCPVISCDFYCEEGEFFPKPQPGCLFMSLRQEYVDVEVLEMESSLYENIGHAFNAFWEKYDTEKDNSVVFITLAMYLYLAAIQEGYILTGYEERQAYLRCDYNNFYIYLQKADVELTITADCNSLKKMIDRLKKEAVIQNHPFLVIPE